jgi:hypothetical protein
MGVAFFEASEPSRFHAPIDFLQKVWIAAIESLEIKKTKRINISTILRLCPSLRELTVLCSDLDATMHACSGMLLYCFRAKLKMTGPTVLHSLKLFSKLMVHLVRMLRLAGGGRTLARAVGEGVLGN